MYDQKYYTYRITWSEDDNEYVGLCAEFPSLSYMAESRREALEGIEDVVGDVLLDMRENNEEAPEPLSIKQYSGKFLVRVTPHQHKDITIRAKEMNVSVNRYVSSKLAIA